VPEKLAILEQYLNRFKAAVQRYFSVQAGSPPAAFAEVADGFPVFALAEIQRSPPSS
jgi:hypothetical protein